MIAPSRDRVSTAINTWFQLQVDSVDARVSIVQGPSCSSCRVMSDPISAFGVMISLPPSHWNDLVIQIPYGGYPQDRILKKWPYRRFYVYRDKTRSNIALSAI